MVRVAHHRLHPVIRGASLFSNKIANKNSFANKIGNREQTGGEQIILNFLAVNLATPISIYQIFFLLAELVIYRFKDLLEGAKNLYLSVLKGT